MMSLSIMSVVVVVALGGLTNHSCLKFVLQFSVFKGEIMQQAEMTVDEDSLTSCICFLNNEFLY